MEVMMRGKSAILGMPLVGLVTCGTVHAAPRQPACVEIMAVCEQAGFVRGDAKAGDGLFVDCVVPILRGRVDRSPAVATVNSRAGVRQFDAADWADPPRGSPLMAEALTAPCATGARS